MTVIKQLILCTIVCVNTVYMYHISIALFLITCMLGRNPGDILKLKLSCPVHLPAVF